MKWQLSTARSFLNCIGFESDAISVFIISLNIKQDFSYVFVVNYFLSIGLRQSYWILDSRYLSALYWNLNWHCVQWSIIWEPVLKKKKTLGTKVRYVILETCNIGCASLRSNSVVAVNGYALEYVVKRSRNEIYIPFCRLPRMAWEQWLACGLWIAWGWGGREDA
jgi:hypothetical protein